MKRIYKHLDTKVETSLRAKLSREHLMMPQLKLRFLPFLPSIKILCIEPTHSLRSVIQNKDFSNLLQPLRSICLGQVYINLNIIIIKYHQKKEQDLLQALLSFKDWKNLKLIYQDQEHITHHKVFIQSLQTLMRTDQLLYHLLVNHEKLLY